MKYARNCRTITNRCFFFFLDLRLVFTYAPCVGNAQIPAANAWRHNQRKRISSRVKTTLLSIIRSLSLIKHGIIKVSLILFRFPDLNNCQINIRQADAYQMNTTICRVTSRSAAKCCRQVGNDKTHADIMELAID